MKELRRLAIAVPAALLVLCLAAAWWTRGAMAHMPFLKANGSPAGANNLIDQRPWQTIESLAPSPSPRKSNPSLMRPSVWPTTRSIRPSPSPFARPPSRPVP
ncbi:hypothetical protein [Tunturiibacter gelidiferens]|uniref:hypothetical protein n=1 Tax=Tunturiibacter gelidiferens TaxID=3069689 RepID=UPI003D9BCB3B